MHVCVALRHVAAVPVPAQLASLTQATQEPAPSHTLPPFAVQGVSAAEGVLFCGTPPLHQSSVQGSPSSGFALSSAVLMHVFNLQLYFVHGFGVPQSATVVHGVGSPASLPPYPPSPFVSTK
jgi:hypothetical protein